MSKDVGSELRTDGRPTKSELEAAMKKQHDLDNTDKLKRFFKIFKKKRKGEVKERINWYLFSPISDGWLIKYEIEGFIHGTSMGTRPMKIFLSEEKKIELEEFLDKFPKRAYVDRRDNTQKNRPEEKTRTVVTGPERLLDLDDIWNTKNKKDKKEEKEEDIWGL